MYDQQQGRVAVWGPVFLWILFIMALSSVSGRNIPDLPVPFFHKVVHFFEYSVLGALWMRALTYGRSGGKSFVLSILAWTLTAIFALSDEWHQTFVPGRSGRSGDAFFDMVCAAVGIAFYVFVKKAGSGRPEEKESHA